MNKSLYLLKALIFTFLFPVFSFSQIENDTILTGSIDTVFVKAKRAIGNVFISSEEINRVPSLLGEKDLFKYLATLPGVVSVNALDPGIYVRGGNSMENAYMINDLEVANPNHLTGIIAVYDPYVLGNSTFYKSGYPVRYNNYLSSYINMLPVRGSTEKVHGELTVGLLSSAIKMKGPVGHPNHTFAVSARTSYLQHIARIYNKANKGESMPSYGFSDITLHFHSKLSDKWDLSLFGLYTSDKLDIDLYKHDIQHALKWNTFSSNVKFRYMGSSGILSIAGGGNTNKTSGNTSSFNQLSVENEYMNGFGTIHYDGFAGEKLEYNIGTGVALSSYDLETQRKTSVGIYKLYGGVRFRFWDDLLLDAGLNYQHYNGRGHANDLSPRVKLNYYRKQFSFWVDYARTVQYTTLYPYFTLKSPIDMSYPLSAGYKPASSHHYSVGVDAELLQDIRVYAALFYKKMYHVKDFISNVRSVQGDLEELLTEGRGKAKGIELDAVYENRNIYFRMTYTLSESIRNFAEINDGRDFHPPFDLKHNLLVSGSWRVSSRWKLNASWGYYSGGYATFPVSVAVAQDIFNYESGSRFVAIYKDRYNFKLPDNHRLDMSVDYEKSGKRIHYKWSFGAYNLYNKQNPTFVYFQPQMKDNYYTQFVPYSKVLLPFIPYLSLTISW
ncbi:MAG: TonB-dependent receptor [Tannerellaceae bacterium]|nr:TonB-dependent receptor [Tannerellaceae bacterium]